MEQHPIKINKVQIRNLQIEDYVQLSNRLPAFILTVAMCFGLVSRFRS